MMTKPDTGTAKPKGEQVSNERAPALSDEDKIAALDTETFDAADYQEEGQGGPRKGLKKNA